MVPAKASADDGLRREMRSREWGINKCSLWYLLVDWKYVLHLKGTNIWPAGRHSRSQLPHAGIYTRCYRPWECIWWQKTALNRSVCSCAVCHCHLEMFLDCNNGCLITRSRRSSSQISRECLEVFDWQWTEEELVAFRSWTPIATLFCWCCEALKRWDDMSRGHGKLRRSGDQQGADFECPYLFLHKAFTWMR